MKKCNGCFETKTNDQFNVRHYKSGAEGLKSKCKECRHLDRMAWRAANPKDNERNKAYNKAHSEEIRGKKLAKNYWPHLTWQQATCEWNLIYEKQNKLCAFGHKVDLLHVDHNHMTGQIRGLLCYNCNNGIGRLKEDIEVLEKAIEYLKYYSQNDGY